MPSSLRQVVEKVKALVLGSTTFQAAATAASKTAAQCLHLQAQEIDEEGEPLPRPAAAVWSEEMELFTIAGGDRITLWPGGLVLLYLASDAVESAETDINARNQAQYLAACDFHGGVIDNIRDLQGTDDAADAVYDHLELKLIKSIVLVNRVDDTVRKSAGDFFFSLWAFHWGHRE